MRQEFAVHRLNEQGLKKAERIGEIISTALTELEQEGVTGRELALVITKFQEAGFFAKRSIATRPENQQA